MRLSTRSLACSLSRPDAATLRADDKSQAAKVKAFDAYAAKGVADWKVPGLAVAMVKDGRVVLRPGLWRARAGPAGARDHADALRHRLHHQGHDRRRRWPCWWTRGSCGWDDPVIRHLPGFALGDPWLTRQVTVRDLLTHRAGMPNADFLWYRTGASPADVLKRFALVKPESSLRSRFHYQNVMYHAAGEVIAAVSGVPWAEFVQTADLRPPGHERQRAPRRASSRRGRTWPRLISRSRGQVKVIPNARVDNVAAAGAVWSGARRHGEVAGLPLGRGKVGEKTLLSEASLRELFAPQTMVDAHGFYPTAKLTKPHWTTYGLGWFQQDYDGRAVDFHTGSIDGMVAICGLLRDQGWGWWSWPTSTTPSCATP